MAFAIDILLVGLLLIVFFAVRSCLLQLEEALADFGRANHSNQIISTLYDDLKHKFKEREVVLLEAALEDSPFTSRSDLADTVYQAFTDSESGLPDGLSRKDVREVVTEFLRQYQSLTPSEQFALHAEMAKWVLPD